MKTLVVLTAMLLAAFGSAAQDESESPDVNRVIEDMATVGPEALLSRVKELKQSEQALEDEAAALRAQADQKEAEAAATRARIEAVERFTSELATAMNPPQPTAPEAAAPAAPEPPAAPAEPAVETPVEPEPTQVSVEVEEESAGGMGGEEQM